MNRLEFHELIETVNYATPVKIRFEKSYLARRLASSLSRWTYTGRMRYLICWKRTEKTITVRKFWHGQLGVNVIKRYYDTLNLTEINQIVNSPLFKK